jgi:hypothetical protein
MISSSRKWSSISGPRLEAPVSLPLVSPIAPSSASLPPRNPPASFRARFPVPRRCQRRPHQFNRPVEAAHNATRNNTAAPAIIPTRKLTISAPSLGAAKKRACVPAGRLTRGPARLKSAEQRKGEHHERDHTTYERIPSVNHRTLRKKERPALWESGPSDKESSVNDQRLCKVNANDGSRVCKGEEVTVFSLYPIQIHRLLYCNILL